jgi:hypothetical protein
MLKEDKFLVLLEVLADNGGPEDLLPYPDM